MTLPEPRPDSAPVVSEPVASARRPSDTDPTAIIHDDVRAWRWLKPLLGYAVAATTVCAAAGVITTWVRYEALDGIGTYAVVAAERGDLLAAGFGTILGTLLFAIGLVAGLLLFLVAMIQVQRRRAQPTRTTQVVQLGARPLAAAWRYAAAHPWLVHLFLPAVALALIRWTVPSLIKENVVGYALLLVVAIAALASLIVGFARALGAAMQAMLDPASRSWLRRVRWMRWPLVIAFFTGLILVNSSWSFVGMISIALAWLAYAVRVARLHPEYAALPWHRVLARQREAFGIFLLMICIMTAITNEADAPSHLGVVNVEPSSGVKFHAIALGQRAGRAAFLRLTDADVIVHGGVTELSPGAVKRVDRIGEYDGPRNGRSFARRLQTWFSSSTPALGT
jgi:hypothetical protein